MVLQFQEKRPSCKRGFGNSVTIDLDGRGLCLLYDQLKSPHIFSTLPGACRSHKGSKDARKLSTRRREELFGSDTTQLESGKRVIHSSAAQMEAKLAWVCFIYFIRSVLIQPFRPRSIWQSEKSSLPTIDYRFSQRHYISL